MSRRTSPRTLNNRTGRDDSESFTLEDDLPWTPDQDDDDEDYDDDEDHDADDVFELTEYDEDWDAYWRHRRRYG